MKLMVTVVSYIAVLALCQAMPRSRWGNRRGASANSEGRSRGGYTNINTNSDVLNNGWGSRARSTGSGSATGRGHTDVDLTSSAGLNGFGGRSRAGANAFGDRASSSAGANAVDVDNRRIALGGSGSSGSVSLFGRGSAGSYATGEDNFSRVGVKAIGGGIGDLVVSGSNSGIGMVNSRANGKASGFSNASGRRYSATETGAKYYREG